MYVLARVFLPVAVIVVFFGGTLLVLDKEGPKPENKGPGGIEQVAGDSPKSLYRAENFAKVIKTLRKEVGPEGVVTNLRLDASRANATIRTGGQGKNLTIAEGGDVKSTVSIPASTGDGFSPRKLNPKAPERIASAIKEQSGFGLDQIDYMVALQEPIDNKLEWDAFTKDNNHTNYLADADGRDVHHPGGGTVESPGIGSSGSSGSPSTGQTRTFTGKKAQEINECISKAGTDPAKIQACVQ